MPRTYVIIGSQSELARATSDLLEAAGDRVIDVDPGTGSSPSELGTPEARAAFLDRIGELAGGSVDGVIATDSGSPKGSGAAASVGDTRLLATIEAMKPLLARSPAPRAVVATTASSLAAATQAAALGTTWAGSGIPLNAVAPSGSSPENAAGLVAWLASEANAHLCGHVIHVGDAS